MFTVLFYSKEWEHLGNSRWLVFFSERRELESRRNFSRNFYGFWIEDIQLSPFRIFFGFFSDTFKINIKIVFAETIKHIWNKKIQNPWHSGKHSKEKNHKICQKTCRTLIVLIFNCLIFLILIFLILSLVLCRLKIRVKLGLGSG